MQVSGSGLSGGLFGGRCLKVSLVRARPRSAPFNQPAVGEPCGSERTSTHRLARGAVGVPFVGAYIDVSLLGKGADLGRARTNDTFKQRPPNKPPLSPDPETCIERAT